MMLVWPAESLQLRFDSMHFEQITRLFSLIDFLGVLAAAMAGTLAAVRDASYKYDLVGVFGLSLAAALGGGILRDIILQKGPPLAFTDYRYLPIALMGVLLALVFTARIGRNIQQAIVVIDAASLGFFAVAGSIRALAAGLKPLASLFLGLIAAVGGGALRDVLSGKAPQIFESGEIYAIAAMVGSAIFLGCDALKLARPVSTFIGVVSTFGFRILAIRFHWRTRPIYRRYPRN